VLSPRDRPDAFGLFAIADALLDDFGTAHLLPNRVLLGEERGRELFENGRFLRTPLALVHCLTATGGKTILHIYLRHVNNVEGS
jgi:hypothetical protein